MADDVYLPGALIRLPVAWQDATDAYADPTALTLTVTQPDGTDTVYAWPANIQQDSLGHFHYDLDLTAAMGGQWFYHWVATGTVQGISDGYFSVATHSFGDLVREVRDEFDDYPPQTFIVDDPLDRSATALTIPDSDLNLFPTGRMWLECDDFADEQIVTTGPADVATSQVPIRRAQRGTVARNHAKDTSVFISPRFPRPRIVRAINHIIDTELWPFVWAFEEGSLAYQGANYYYPSPSPDIEEIVYAYQVISGDRYPMTMGWLPPSFAEGADFPYGALTPSAVYDSSTIYFGYRARPNINNLTSALRSLVVMGAVAHIQINEESKLVGPDAPVVNRGLQPGARSRAGIVALQRFQAVRSQLSISLMAEETDRRSPAQRVV